MTPKLALRLHEMSRKTLSLERLYAIEPRTWPAEKLRALAESKARVRRRLVEAAVMQALQSPEAQVQDTAESGGSPAGP
jgi:hypothetical protein